MTDKELKLEETEASHTRRNSGISFLGSWFYMLCECLRPIKRKTNWNDHSKWLCGFRVDDIITVSDCVTTNDGERITAYDCVVFVDGFTSKICCITCKLCRLACRRTWLGSMVLFVSRDCVSVCVCVCYEVMLTREICLSSVTPSSSSLYCSPVCFPVVLLLTKDTVVTVSSNW